MSWATFFSSIVGAFLGGGVSTAIASQLFKIQEENQNRRAKFAELELRYVSQWIGSTAVFPIDQMKTLRPTAMVTGFYAYEIAEWATNAVARINNSKLDDEHKRTALWDLSSQLGKELSRWVMHPHKKWAWWNTPFKHDGVIDNSEWRKLQITRGGSVKH